MKRFTSLYAAFLLASTACAVTAQDFAKSFPWRLAPGNSNTVRYCTALASYYGGRVYAYQVDWPAYLVQQNIDAVWTILKVPGNASQNEYGFGEWTQIGSNFWQQTRPKAAAGNALTVHLDANERYTTGICLRGGD
ncbi:hypothetical protein [Deinococcus yavapaiensis]|uniref:Uncharacterized protein n=1 Tax=Deinococcus yavapaiensis KR-236 TaxID=694435 RepID=A0A318S696_9DEIO|nr:hypothetical protein [Deinococcus yavapaiensis]PYE54193.1 hypothetical protein DES52_106159 [Deinococcus yavapaiensis KR-236]